jgi:hypothetical protein
VKTRLVNQGRNWITRRLITASLIVAAGCCTGFVGCGEESKSTTEIKQTGPGGTTTEKKTDSVNESGKNPPAPTGATNQPPPK